MAKMFLICGISGVGKTTLSKRMAEKHDLFRLGIDDFYAKINGDEKDRKNKFDVWIEFFKEIHNAEVSNTDCVIEISGLTRRQRREFVEWFPTFEHHLIFIEADANLRNENNSSRIRVVPQWRISEMEKKVQFPDVDSEDNMFNAIALVKNHNNQFAMPMMIKGDWQFDEYDYNN